GADQPGALPDVVIHRSLSGNAQDGSLPQSPTDGANDPSRYIFFENNPDGSHFEIRGDGQVRLFDKNGQAIEYDPATWKGRNPAWVQGEVISVTGQVSDAANGAKAAKSNAGKPQAEQSTQASASEAAGLRDTRGPQATLTHAERLSQYQQQVEEGFSREDSGY